MEFIEQHYQWVFSGVGSGIIFWILGNKNCIRKLNKQNMKTGPNSTSIQVGGNYTTNQDKEKENV